MADRMKPVEAAKRLSVQPQRIYNLIKQGRLKTFADPGGGKVALVDLGEAKIVLSQVRTRGPRGTKTKGAGGLPRGLARGSIISSQKFPIKGAFARPNGGMRVRSVVDATSQIVWLSDGTIETVWATDSLQEALTNKKAHIESIPALLGMVIYQWRQEGLEKRAEEFEAYLEAAEIGYFPISTPHKLLEEEQEEAPPKPTEWKEIEIPEGGLDLSTVEL